MCQRASLFFFCLLLIAKPLSAQSVNFILEDLFVEQEVPGTSVVVNDDIQNGNWSFSETNMVGLNVAFNNNRHEFMFSDDGVNPLQVDGDESWHIAFDIALDGALLSPRKAFNFVVFDGGSLATSPDSFINLTTNRTPAPLGLSDVPGESAMFGGEYEFVRLIGPADGDPSINLNPTVGYDGGDTVRIEIIHTPSPDGGVTPSTVEHIYDDGTGPYTTGARDLRRSGVFQDGATLGFIVQGIAHEGTPVDSYSVDISNFSATFGSISGDFDGDGDYACADIDALVAEIVAGTNNPAFDLTGDGAVDVADRDAWLAEAGAAELPSMNPYLPGDATLDGVVDGQDFILWNDNKFLTTAAWCRGDFSADGSTDGQDFILWNDNKFTSSDTAVVPEPSTLALWWMLGMAFTAGAWRRNGNASS